MRTAAAALLVLLAATSATAADDLFTVEAPLAKPKKPGDARLKEPLDRVRLKVWLPDGVKPIRGVVFNPFNEKQVEQTTATETARAWGFGVVGADYFGVDQKDYGPSLVAGLKKLAAEQKRPELTNVPILMVGMSAGAGMCVRFAEQLPDRTLGCGLACLEVGPTDPATRRIPMLTVFGEKDGRQMELLMDKLPQQRKLGARWAVAVQWNRRHEWGQANNLILPFFDDVIRLRLPAGADPSKGPVNLLDIPEERGVLALPPEKGAMGVPPIFSAGAPHPDVARACWFPSAGAAQAWQGFVGRSKAAIASPAPVGDGKALTVLDAGKPVVLSLTGVKGMRHFTVTVNGIPAPLVTRADDGDTAEVTVPAVYVGTGVKLLVVQSADDSGTIYPPLRPTVVVVR